MANPEQGEVAVEIGGTSYTLKSSINASIEVEAMLSKQEGRKVFWKEVIDSVNAGSLLHKRAVFWATLRTHHPDVTIERAGELSDMLDQKLMKSTLSEVLTLGTPDAADVKELTPKTRPQRAQTINHRRRAGTGAGSSSGDVKSV